MSPIITSIISALGAIRDPSSTVSGTNAGDAAISSAAAKRPIRKRRRQSYIRQRVKSPDGARYRRRRRRARDFRRRSAPSPRRNVADAKSERRRRQVGTSPTPSRTSKHLDPPRAFSRPRVRKAPWFIHCLIVPKGCSTVSRRRSRISGLAFSRSAMRSSASSSSRRETARTFFVQRGRSAQARQAFALP